MSGKKSQGASAVKALIIGIGAAILLSAALLAVLAKLHLSETIGERGVEWGVYASLLAAVAVGGLLSIGIHPEENVINGLLTAAGLVIVITIGALAIDGPFQNILMPILASALGGILSCGISIKTKGKVRHRKKRYR